MAEQKKKPGRPKGSKNKTTASRSKTTKKSSGNKNSRSAKQAKKGTYGRASRSDKSLSPKESRLRDEIAAIIMLAIGAFFAVSMHTKLAGQVGFFVSQGLKGVFGHGGYILPYFLIIYSILIFFKKNRPIRLRSVVLMTLIFLFMDLLNAERFLSGAKVGFDQFSYIFAEGVALRSGGIFGIYVGELMFRTIGSMGLFIVCIVGILVSTLLLVNTPLSAAYDKAKEKKAERLQKKEELRLRREEALREQEAELAQGQQMTINTSDQDFLGEHVSGFVPVEQKKRNKSIMNLMENDPKYGLNGPSHEEDMAQCFEREKKKKFGLFSNSLGRDESKKDSDAIDFVGGNVGNNEDFSHIENLRAMDDEPPKIKFASDNFSGETFLGEGFAGESLGAGVSGEPKVDLGLKAEDASAKASVGSKAEDGNAKIKKADVLVAKKELEDQLEDSKKAESKHYVMPPLSLLNIPKRKLNVKNSNQELLESAKMLEETLASFNVKAKVVNVTKGSSVTRYEIQPAVGVKVSSIVRLSDDIALNLKARSIRMEAPIPGKAAVGIEVENESRDMVTISEILSSKEFTSHESKLVFGVGKDISGNPIVSDLGKMPHLLIAGATGSGKSVCINTIIASILYKARPDEVKMVLIDPKMVELGNYNGIPHLLIPVVTDPTKAAAALNWAVAEMTNRYKKFAKAGVRGIKGYNALMEKEGNKEEVLPKIVIIIDELADLMMVASNQVEDAICRLAQLARAAGMHLIVATQRPSVDVITGLIKANIPSRIAFMVSSQIDSRTIIDMPGAEKLVGNGDMLFKPQDLNKPLRIQGPFISDNEVRDLIEFVKSQSDDNVSYDNDMLEQIEKNPSAKEGADEDELLDDAIECVVLAGQASVSMLQRRFRIGYNRAARIIDIMEDRGIVGPQDGSRPRTVNLSQSDLEEMRNLKEEE